MIKVSPVSRNPWFPGATAGEAAPPSKRSAEIAKRQEELLELLRGVPEQELELSFTDLVEEGLVSVDEGRTVVSAEYSTPASVPDEAAKSKQEQKSLSSSSAKKRKKELSSGTRRFRSRSDSVLLRFYVPASLTRSRTAPAAGPRQHAFLCRDDGNFDGEIEVTSLGCWSALWNRKTKSRRQVL